MNWTRSTNATLPPCAGRETQAERAIRILGAAEAYCETLGLRPPVGEPTAYVRTVSEAHSVLVNSLFAAAWAEGRTMSLEQAIEYALLAPHDPPPAACVSSSPFPSAGESSSFLSHHR